jgi:glycosyltransferase involved in cell wall biosynthesis
MSIRNQDAERISVVLCARNEAEGIAGLIAEVRNYASEVIVVDGHSTDDTKAVSAKAGARVFEDSGKGKGSGYLKGYEEARNDVIVLMDADGSHDPAEIPVMAGPILEGRAHMVVGSRHRGGSDEWGGDMETFLRAAGAGWLSVVINWRWKTNLTDVLNGYRAVSRETARKVPLKALDFDVEQHMIVQYLKRGYKVVEVRSHEYLRRWGRSKLPTYRKAYLFFWRLFLDVITP